MAAEAAAEEAGEAAVHFLRKVVFRPRSGKVASWLAWLTYEHARARASKPEKETAASLSTLLWRQITEYYIFHM